MMHIKKEDETAFYKVKYVSHDMLIGRALRDLPTLENLKCVGVCVCTHHLTHCTHTHTQNCKTSFVVWDAVHALLTINTSLQHVAIILSIPLNPFIDQQQTTMKLFAVIVWYDIS